MGGPSPYANYGQRLGGWLIDFVLLGVISLLLAAPLHAVHAGTIHFTTTNTNTGVVHHYSFSFLSEVLHGLVVILYGGILCGSTRGQTVGMMATGIRAVDQRTGGALGFWKAALRGLVEYVLFLVFFFPWVLDMLWPLWDQKNQTLHDKVVSSVVLRKVPAYAVPPGGDAYGVQGWNGQPGYGQPGYGPPPA